MCLILLIYSYNFIIFKWFLMFVVVKTNNNLLAEKVRWPKRERLILVENGAAQSGIPPGSSRHHKYAVCGDATYCTAAVLQILFGPIPLLLRESRARVRRAECLTVIMTKENLAFTFDWIGRNTDRRANGARSPISGVANSLFSTSRQPNNGRAPIYSVPIGELTTFELGRSSSAKPVVHRVVWRVFTIYDQWRIFNIFLRAAEHGFALKMYAQGVHIF